MYTTLDPGQTNNYVHVAQLTGRAKIKLILLERFQIYGHYVCKKLATPTASQKCNLTKKGVL